MATADKAFDAEKARGEVEKARLTAALPRDSLPERDWQENQLDLQRKQVAYAKAKDDLESQRRARRSTPRSSRSRSRSRSARSTRPRRPSRIWS